VASGQRPPSEPPRDYLTIQQAADYLSVSRRTILRRLRDGTLTRYRLGGAVRISRAQLDWRMAGDGASELAADVDNAVERERWERYEDDS
jgi:excisionase family DNA binding protein